MKKFEGFPVHFNFTRVPSPFVTEILPEIEHLGELIISLYYFWRIEQMEGDFRYVRKKDIFQDEKLISKIGIEELEIGLNKAVDRGTLLICQIEIDGVITDLIFVNTERGKNAITAIADGLWTPTGDPEVPISLDMDRPNIFRLYEENIGPLTPLIGDALKDAEKIFPSDWIMEAIGKSVENNARSWRYVLAILERWQEEGKNVQTQENRRSSEKARKKYTE